MSCQALRTHYARARQSNVLVFYEDLLNSRRLLRVHHEYLEPGSKIKVDGALRRKTEAVTHEMLLLGWHGSQPTAGS